MALGNKGDDKETVIVAKLRRGKNYKHFYEGRYVAFTRNVPVEVSAELADELEALVERVEDDDGEQIEKEYFYIDRDATPRELEAPTKRIRIRTVREEVEDVPVRQRPAVRKAPAPNAKPSSGFGKRAVTGNR